MGLVGGNHHALRSPPPAYALARRVSYLERDARPLQKPAGLHGEALPHTILRTLPMALGRFAYVSERCLRSERAGRTSERDAVSGPECLEIICDFVVTQAVADRCNRAARREDERNGALRAFANRHLRIAAPYQRGWFGMAAKGRAGRIVRTPLPSAGAP